MSTNDDRCQEMSATALHDETDATTRFWAQAYQRDGRRVEDLAPHRVDNLQLAGQADVGDERPQWPPLQAGERLRLGRHDRRGDASLCLLTDLATQRAQVVDVLGVDRQLVGGRGLCRPFRVGPASLCSRARPHDVVRVGPSQVAAEGHIEAQVDLGAGRDDGRR